MTLPDHGRVNKPHHVFMRVIVQPGGCWEWQGATNANGYGMIGYRGKVVRAHRMAYCSCNGIKPEELRGLVMHKCDNPRCCNPLHLIVGSWQDNSNDMKNKGRTVHGKKNHNSKINDEIARSIYVDTRPYDVIAESYGITGATVGQICRGETWRHATTGLQRPQRQLVRGADGRYSVKS